MTTCEEDFAIAAYAIERAMEMTFDAKIKGPCQNEKFYGSVSQALELLNIARKSLKEGRA